MRCRGCQHRQPHPINVAQWWWWRQWTPPSPRPASLAEGEDKKDDGQVDGRDGEDVARVQSGRRQCRADPLPEVGTDHPLDAPDIDAHSSWHGGGCCVTRPLLIVVIVIVFAAAAARSVRRLSIVLLPAAVPFPRPLPAAFLSLLSRKSITFATPVDGWLLCSPPAQQHTHSTTNPKTFSCSHIWTYFDLLRVSMRLFYV